MGRNEKCPVAEVTVFFPVPVAARNFGRCKRASMVAAHKGDHQRLAPLVHSNKLKAVFDCLSPADVKMHAALFAKPLFSFSRDCSGKKNLLFMEILGGNLR